ncbi:MAG: glycosyltransferase family 4 protein [Myxococcales bacterium]|nr:glycosyltransferase family 4 protein [Myxococcales bacterium]
MISELAESPHHGTNLTVRILYVNQVGSTVGGIEAHIRDCATGLSQRGYTLGLLSGDPHLETALARPFSTTFVGRPFSPAVLKQAINEFQPDLVIVHKAERLFELELESVVPPVVVMIHDHDWICIRRHRYLPITGKICERQASISACFSCGLAVERKRGTTLGIRYRPVWHRIRDARTLHAVSGVWVASDYMKRELSRHGIDSNHITTIPLGIPDLPETYTKAAMGSIAYIGQVIRTKGLDLLLRAVAQEPSIQRLDIVGDGNQRNEFEALATSLGVDTKTVWHGKQTPNDVARIIAGAAVVVMPHRWPEPFGLVGLEAMRAGRPVITTDAGGVRTWLDPGITGLLTKPLDVPGLGRALRILLTQTERRETMGQAARSRFIRYFTMERFLERLEEAIKKTTSHPKRHTCISQ